MREVLSPSAQRSPRRSHGAAQACLGAQRASQRSGLAAMPPAGRRLAWAVQRPGRLGRCTPSKLRDTDQGSLVKAPRPSATPLAMASAHPRFFTSLAGPGRADSHLEMVRKFSEASVPRCCSGSGLEERAPFVSRSSPPAAGETPSCNVPNTNRASPGFFSLIFPEETRPGC